MIDLNDKQVKAHRDMSVTCSSVENVYAKHTHTHARIRADYAVAEVREIVVTFKWSPVEREPSCGPELALMYSSIVAGAFETIGMYQKCAQSSSALCGGPRKHTVNPVDMDYFPQSNNRSSKSRLGTRLMQRV